MSLLTKNSTPAERGRGCLFVEQLIDANSVAANGAAITGTPTFSNGLVLTGSECLLYNYAPWGDVGDYSVNIDITHISGRGSAQVIAHWGTGINDEAGYIKIDADDTIRMGANNAHQPFTGTGIPLSSGRHTITVRFNGASARSVFLDGVQLSGGSSGGGAGVTDTAIAIGSEIGGTNKYIGTIHSVKMFSEMLTLQEHTDIYNGEVYSYRNESIVDLPMDFANNDPTNGLVKDVSGNGNDATMPGGTSDPIKNTHINGYRFDGVDDGLDVPNLGFSANDEYTVSIMAQFDSYTLDQVFLILGYDYGNEEGWVLEANQPAGGFRVYNKGSGSIIINDIFVQLGQWFHFVITHDGTDLHVYVNGQYRETESAFNYGYASGTSYRLGIENFDPHNPFAGSLTSFKVWNSELTPLQIQDLYNNELKRVNNK